MGFIAQALSLIKLRQYSAAARLLEEHLNDQGLKQDSRIGMMAWIADCYLKLENRENAAGWFERAGRAALECKELPQIERERRALGEFEQALSNYELVNNVKGMQRVASLKYSLIKT